MHAARGVPTFKTVSTQGTSRRSKAGILWILMLYVGRKGVVPSHVRGRKIVHRLNETVEVDVAYTIKHGQPALYSCAAFMR